MNCWVLFVALLFVVNTHCDWTLKPGFKSTISLEGLTYMKDVGLSILKSELSNIHIPSIINHLYAGELGTVDYNLSSIAWLAVDVLESQLNFVPNTSVHIIANNVTVNVSLDWHIRTRNWPNFEDSGSFFVSVSDVFVNVTVSGGVANGRPTAEVTNCNVSIGIAIIDFSGPSSWVYNLLMSEIADAIREEMEVTLAAQITSGVSSTANEALGSLPTVEKIDAHVEIDYDLIASPVASEEFFTFYHKGEFFRVADPENSPYIPSVMPNSATSQMVQMFISDYTANSVAFAYFIDGVFTVKITDSMLPADAPLRLNTTYFSELIPPLNETYPDELMELALYAIIAPSFTFDDLGATLVVAGNMDVHVEPSNALAFTLTVEFIFEGKAGISNMYLTGDLTFLNATIDLAYTAIGPFDPSVLQDAINALASAGLLPALNGALQKGFQLPTITGLNFTNATIGYGPGYLYVSTSILYDPQF